MGNGSEMRDRAVPELKRICADARIFLSMPWVEGVTPRALVGGELHESAGDLPRRHGVFKVDEVGIPVFDHGLLYGDGVFEGILVTGGRLFTWREHLERFERSAKGIRIQLPYAREDLTAWVLEAVRQVGLRKEERGYIRLVATRGLGDLGIHPDMCVGSTLFSIAARIQLYPESVYEKGISLSVARKVKRPGVDVLDPNVKSCNYLNNILGLLETLDGGCLETLMLTGNGFVAEATADNIFLIRREEGWKSDPSKVRGIVPADHYGLRGITRGLVLDAAGDAGYRVERSETLTPESFAKIDQEAFLTGTGAGVLPVVTVDGQGVGNGNPGPVTRTLRQALLDCMADPALGLSLDASESDIAGYLAE